MDILPPPFASSDIALLPSTIQRPLSVHPFFRVDLRTHICTSIYIFSRTHANIYVYTHLFVFFCFKAAFLFAVQFIVKTLRPWQRILICVVSRPWLRALQALGSCILHFPPKPVRSQQAAIKSRTDKPFRQHFCVSFSYT